MEWQPIETAPKDGTPIQARIPSHGEDNIIGYHDIDPEYSAWTFVTDQEPPACWTDGWCWGSNEDCVQSVQPTHWKTPPKDKT